MPGPRGAARGRFPALLGPLMAERGVALALGGLALVQTALVTLHLPGWPCVFRQATGIPCPGCGLSRATVALVRGDWPAALRLHAFAPLLAACALALLVSSLLDPGRRRRLAARVSSLESRTGAAVWLAAVFLVYWAVRLLYYPHTFTSPG